MSSGQISDLRIKRADDILQKARGFMFRKKEDYALLIPFGRESKNNSIHSFFVFFSFHAIFLDEEKRVVDIERDIPPFRGGISSDRPARYVLEVPTGEVNIEEISIGRKLESPELR